jgi:hypothetical protein
MWLPYANSILRRPHRRNAADLDRCGGHGCDRHSRIEEAEALRNLDRGGRRGGAYFDPHERPATSPLTDRPEVLLEQEHIPLSISTALIETGARRISSRSGVRHQDLNG